MIQKITKAILGLLLLLISGSALAQDGTYYTVRDLESWTSAQFKYKPSKKWTLSLQEQLRLKDNSSTVSEFFTEGGIKRNLENNFSIGLGLRYIRENDDQGKVQGYENHFRWNADVQYKHDIERFKLKYRLRYQSKSEMGSDDLATNTLRLKAGVGYNIKKWKLDPEISGELFSRTGTLSEPVKYRLTAGTSYETKSFGEFGAYYRMEQELPNSTYSKLTNIIGVKYSYTLKKKKEKAKPTEMDKNPSLGVF
jgi:hypothetical protein